MLKFDRGKERGRAPRGGERRHRRRVVGSERRRVVEAVRRHLRPHSSLGAQPDERDACKTQTRRVEPLRGVCTKVLVADAVGAREAEGKVRI